MYSSSTPSVYGSLAPKAWSSTLPPGGNLEPLPVIDGGMSESFMRGPYPHGLQEESADRAWQRASFGKERRVRLDLDLPRGVEHPRDDEHRRRREDRTEQLAVRTSDRLPIGRIDEVDASPDDVLGPRAELTQCVHDDLEATLRLFVRIVRIETDGSRSGDIDVSPVAHGAGVADGVGEP